MLAQIRKRWLCWRGFGSTGYVGPDLEAMAKLAQIRKRWLCWRGFGSTGYVGPDLEAMAKLAQIWKRWFRRTRVVDVETVSRWPAWKTN